MAISILFLQYHAQNLPTNIRSNRRNIQPAYFDNPVVFPVKAQLCAMGNTTDIKEKANKKFLKKYHRHVIKAQPLFSMMPRLMLKGNVNKRCHLFMFKCYTNSHTIHGRSTLKDGVAQ